jgi:hypothetical protein
MSKEKMNLGTYEGEQVLEMDIERLRDFRNHPFKITADMSMVELKESITELIPELLAKLDDDELSISSAVEIAFLKKEEQEWFLQAMDYGTY